MIGWHHWCNEHEFEQTLGDNERQGSMACCSPWGHRESDMPWWLKNNSSNAPTTDAREAEVDQFYEDLEDLLELTPKKRCSILRRILGWKSRKLRDTWCNRHGCPWSIKWCSAKANRILPREYTGHSKHTFQQHKRRVYKWASANGQY